MGSRAGLICCAVVAAFLIPASATASTDRAGWQLIEKYPGGTYIELYGISCPSDTFCVAVGNDEPSYDTGLILEYDGSGWGSVGPSMFDADLTGISCPSRNSCMAVGSKSGGPLAVHWDGSSWTIVPVPLPQGGTGAYLRGVRCLTRSSCTGVGGYLTAQDHTQTLVERWNGKKWSVVPSPDPTDQPNASLSAVGCPEASTCFAVGNSWPQFQAPQNGFIERWDGIAWTVQEQALPNTLAAVSCAAVTSCVAVGGLYQSFIERWDGLAWSPDTPPNLTGSNQLRGVSCPLNGSCVAVGFKSCCDSARVFALHWKGGQWVVRRPPGGTGVELFGVTCRRPTYCMAIGSKKYDGNQSEGIAELYSR
jgi:hypothetical protein